MACGYFRGRQEWLKSTWFSDQNLVLRKDVFLIVKIHFGLIGFSRKHKMDKKQQWLKSIWRSLVCREGPSQGQTRKDRFEKSHICPAPLLQSGRH